MTDRISEKTCAHGSASDFNSSAISGATYRGRGTARPHGPRRLDRALVEGLDLGEVLLLDHAPSAIRLLCLSRPWSQPWDHTPELLQAAEDIPQQLYAAAGRDGSEKAVGDIRELRRHDLDAAVAVALALALALDEGRPAARHLVDVLKLA